MQSIANIHQQRIFSPSLSTAALDQLQTLAMKIELGKVLQKRGIRPSQLADGIGVSRGYISEIMSGKKRPSIEKIDEIVRFTGATHAELFGAPTGSSAPGLDDPGVAFIAAPTGERSARAVVKKTSAQHLKATRSHVTFAILEGDVLHIDGRKNTPDGGLFVVNKVDLMTGEATTLVRRAFADSVQSDDPAAAPEAWNSETHEYAIMGKIVRICRDL